MFIVFKKNNIIIFSIIAFLFIFSYISYSTFADIKKINKFNNIIVIDAGHGGEDGGAIGYGNVLEKDINLKIAKKLKYEFKNQGFNVVMTRDKDIMLYNNKKSKNKKREDLNNRIKIANLYNDSIFISIHMNHFIDSKEHGSQIFFSNKNDDNINLVNCIYEELKNNLDKNNKRKPKKTKDIYILNNINSPSCLIECGFISNKNDTINLCNEKYQDKIAKCIVSAVKSYLL